MRRRPRAPAEGWCQQRQPEVASWADFLLPGRGSGSMLGALGPCDSRIANLGEGLMGKEDQGLVDFFVNDIHATSEKMISG